MRGMFGFWRGLAVLALCAAPMAVQAQDATTTPPTETAPAAGTTQFPEIQSPATQFPDGTTPVAKPAPARGTTTIVVSKGGANGQSALDYTAWERAAERAEVTIANPEAADTTLEQTRSQLVDWRAAFQVSQNTNASRIATLREQTAALGPVPAEGETEAAEIAQRRQALADQLIRLQAPRIAADEAFRRADGLIAEIDRILRDRQADQLLQLWPAPINPANWPAALVALKDITLRLWAETASRWRVADGRAALFDNLPLIFILTAIGFVLLWRGRPVVAGLASRLPQPATLRGKRVVELVLSLAQIAIPTLGMVAIAYAAGLTAMLGPLGLGLVQALPAIGFTLAASNWLGVRAFPSDQADSGAVLSLSERRAEGRVLAATLGILLSVETLLQVAVTQMRLSEAAQAVLGFPVLVTTAILLFRLGQMLATQPAPVAEGEENPAPIRFAQRLQRLIGRGTMLFGVLGPVLAGVGYVAAAAAMIFPVAMSLALVAILFILQGLVADIYGLIRKSPAATNPAPTGDGATAEAPPADSADGLVPVLIGFAMGIGSLPVFALIWGARPSDITELWQRFLQGFQVGETQVSPMDFLLFAIIFAAGYAITRLLQGALQGTILPRTNLDAGGQTAVVSGVGYVGVFLSALVAINSAGIDLSGLAIVAGALSVGIGFGLQNIVQNFVSGIILLIERPVSEGDWIDVGGVQGTVKAISVRSTRIQTFDRSDVIVPNADLVSGRVTNFTRFNLSGRLIVPVTVAYGTDTRLVERVLREIAEAQPLVVLNPPPLIAFVGFGADAMNFEVRVILRDVNFTMTVRSEINHQIVARFAEHGIEIPFAQTEVYLRNADGIVQALRGETPAAPRAARRSTKPPADLPES